MHAGVGTQPWLCKQEINKVSRTKRHKIMAATQRQGALLLVHRTGEGEGLCAELQALSRRRDGEKQPKRRRSEEQRLRKKFLDQVKAFQRSDEAEAGFLFTFFRSTLNYAAVAFCARGT